MNNFYINHDAIDLLCKAAFLKDDYFMCFAKYYGYLKRFGFIDNEYSVTYMGKQFVKYYLQRKENSE